MKGTQYKLKKGRKKYFPLQILKETIITRNVNYTLTSAVQLKDFIHCAFLYDVFSGPLWGSLVFLDCFLRFSFSHLFSKDTWLAHRWRSCEHPLSTKTGRTERYSFIVAWVVVECIWHNFLQFLFLNQVKAFMYFIDLCKNKWYTSGTFCQKVCQ